MSMSSLSQRRMVSLLWLLLATFRLGETARVISSSSSTSSLSSSSPPWMEPAPDSNIPESSCSVQDLEHANDSQLYTILQELKQTHFFRHFVVDLDEPCPLAKKKQQQQEQQQQQQQEENNSKKTEEEEEKEREEMVECASEGLPGLDDDAGPACGLKEESPFGGRNLGQSMMPDPQSSTSTSSSSSDTAEDETITCASEGLPDMDDDAGPACGLQEEDPFGSQGHSMMIPSSSSPPTKEPTAMKESSPSSATGDREVRAATENTNDDHDKNDENDAFECDGGKDLDMDEDAEPLCHLTEDDFVSSSPISKFISMALETIRYLGWESESQKETYQWHQQTHMVVEDESADCSADSKAPLSENDLFWQDMCSHIHAGDNTKVVNLVLNPERNTGYNGTHIWRAIYEENCVHGQEDDMCYEERVLYRLLSGLHSSTTLSIAKHYYPPSKRKKRVNWEPNPSFFMEKFADQTEHIRNLHFSYVVLLRALRKASSFLYDYDVRTGNPVEDETAVVLLRRLLDSAILRSCQSVFTAFDESVMFAEKKDELTNKLHSHSLQESFKGVFHNISSILDCVQCQQCKLHGKMAMLGYGTALKILFMNPHSFPQSLERNEVVAFINTIAKFSESIKEVRELTALYWDDQQNMAVPISITSPSAGEVDLVDAAVGLATTLQTSGVITEAQESELVQKAMARDPDLLILAKHYPNDVAKFWQFASTVLESAINDDDDKPDAIVVGSGLAGLAAALQMLDRGGRVVVLEKEHLLGGNSNKASSGINACCPHNSTYGDHLESFYKDTLKSAGDAARPDLIQVLIDNSAGAVAWLKERVGVDLSLLAQLGGHSHKRTHRPSNGMAGAEIIYGMQKAVRKYEKQGTAKILVDTRVTQLLIDNDGRVVGVQCTNKADGTQEIYTHNVVLATGGFASDRRQGSYLDQYRPELMNMPATAGPFSTGDGITLAKSLGAGTTDMDKVQIHPTGWVDPTDPSNPSKILAAELMRGIGGILINDQGKRFCNELGTRAYVADKMLAHDSKYAATGVWDKNSPIVDFVLVLSSSAADDGKKHVDLYSHKGLLTKLEGIHALADWMGIEVEKVRETLRQYQQDAARGADEWGKTSFRGVPQEDLDSETFYAGRVTPVLHYCMGGITIDKEGNVLTEDQNPIPGLHAAGEVTGGVHGANRLGGNSLLECTVFGSLVGKKLPIHTRNPSTTTTIHASSLEEDSKAAKDRPITRQELEQHNNDGDCWVAIHGVVYDLTEFAEEHPAGAESIRVLAGLDGSEAFAAVHNEGILADFDEERIGVLIESTTTATSTNSTNEDCD